MPENFNEEAFGSEGNGWVKGLKKNLIPIAIVVAGLIIGGVVYFTQGGIVQSMPPQQAAQIALDYINQNLLEGATATISQVTEENGVYKVKLEVQGQSFDTYVTKNGKVLFIQGIDLNQQQSSASTGTTIGSFSVSSDQICTENGEPVVYLFGAASCPHSSWEHPIFQQVAAEFSNYVSFHDNMDSENDSDIFQKYSNGGVPTLVLGCKYYRLGSGENSGQETETKNLTALFCKLTSGQPDNLCSSVQDLIDQIQ
jgi:thiol-disulfide isomerase/thioredoxin